MSKMGFNNELYQHEQSEKIIERINYFGGKLYLEFGGKLFDDHHAARVLPGFKPDAKITMLSKLKDQAEIVIVISAEAIEQNKIRGDIGITYDLEVLRLINAFTSIGLYVGSVVVTHFQNQPSAVKFINRLDLLNIKSYKHYIIEDYPSNIDNVLSENGFGKNEYIQTSRSLVVVTAPGPGSGKMATCLSQLYHDQKRGIKSGYAKYETFPIWNLPLKHPVNLAYEAATADLNDLNMIDPYHLEEYNKTTVNYNRDIEIFPVLNAMLEEIIGQSPYKSPTDMGVNMAGFAICDDEVVKKAASQEIIRRYYASKAQLKQGLSSNSELQKIEIILNQLHLSTEDRTVVGATLKRSEETSSPTVAIELLDGRVVTGKTTSLLGAASAAILNSLKVLGGIPHDMPLISPIVIEPIQKLKTEHMGNTNPRLHTDEILIALAICAATNPTAELALKQIENLKGCEAHSSVILSKVDEHVYQKLGLNLTCEAVLQEKKVVL